MVAVRSHQTRDGEVQRGHYDATEDEEVAAAGLLNEHERDAGRDEEDDVLDGGGVEVHVAGEVGHLEDVPRCC